MKKLNKIENKQDKYMKKDFDKKDIWGIHFTIHVIEKKENEKNVFLNLSLFIQVNIFIRLHEGEMNRWLNG